MTKLVKYIYISFQLYAYIQSACAINHNLWQILLSGFKFFVFFTFNLMWERVNYQHYGILRPYCFPINFNVCLSVCLSVKLSVCQSHHRLILTEIYRASAKHVSNTLSPTH